MTDRRQGGLYSVPDSELAVRAGRVGASPTRPSNCTSSARWSSRIGGSFPDIEEASVTPLLASRRRAFLSWVARCRSKRVCFVRSSRSSSHGFRWSGPSLLMVATISSSSKPSITAQPSLCTQAPKSLFGSACSASRCNFANGSRVIEDGFAVDGLGRSDSDLPDGPRGEGATGSPRSSRLTVPHEERRERTPHTSRPGVGRGARGWLARRQRER